MRIEILGSGCKKCLQLTDNTRAALEALGRQAEIAKITDVAAIAAHGVMSTPALAVDGRVLSAGRVLTVPELVKLLGG